MKRLFLASSMLALAAAAQTQTVTPGHGTLTDTSGNVWRITQSGSIMEGDQYTPGGGGTSALAIVNGIVYGKDSSGRGWFALSGNGQYWSTTAMPTGITGTTTQTTSGRGTTTQTSGGTTTTQTSGGTTSGTIATTIASSCGSTTGQKFGIIPLSQDGAGQIIDSSGNLFVPRGINVMYGNGNPSAATLKSLFPAINFVRLAIYNYDSPSSLSSYINDLTSNGIVVELEDHNNNAGGAGGSQGVIFTGQALTTEDNWYAAVASAFKDNPYVWFGTNNEPATKNASGQTDMAGLSHWQKATYDAIRNTGNQSIIFLETSCWTEGGKPICNRDFDASVYAQMSNVAWDNHVYGWLTNYSTDQATNDQFVADNVSVLANIKSAGGTIMPVIIAEYGNSTTGHDIDPNGTQIVNAVNKSISNKGAAGAAAWAWGSGNPGDGLTNGGGLSDYGKQVSSLMSQGTPSNSVCKTSSSTTTTEQTKTVVAQSGSGSQSSDNQSSDSQSSDSQLYKLYNSQSSAQTKTQNDTIAAATASSEQAASDASDSVDAAVKQAKEIQAKMSQYSASSSPGVHAIAAGGDQ